MPDYGPRQGYELAGFVWFQGFNDLVDSWSYPRQNEPGGYDEYGQLLSMLIRDVRKDLSAPNMPFVIGVMGIGGEKEGQKPPQRHFRQAQAMPAGLAEFQGNVKIVETARYWDNDLDELQQRMEKLQTQLEQQFKQDANLSQPAKDEAREKAVATQFQPEELKRLQAGVSNGGYHYLGAAKILAPIGEAFAEALVGAQSARPVKVFVLAGQSNMEGAGFVKSDPQRSGGKGSLEYLARDQASAEKFKHLVDQDGKWVVRDDVWIHYLDRKGPLTVGYGAKDDRIGPELGFGIAIGDAYDEPVLLIKLAWGGKSLAKDFRPPSSGGEIGPYYREIVDRTKAVLGRLPRSSPSLAIAATSWRDSVGTRGGTTGSTRRTTTSMRKTWPISSATSAGISE